ncbi:hypothetical protein D3C74_334910 [compost metagenome]
MSNEIVVCLENKNVENPVQSYVPGIFLMRKYNGTLGKIEKEKPTGQVRLLSYK